MTRTTSKSVRYSRPNCFWQQRALALALIVALSTCGTDLRAGSLCGDRDLVKIFVWTHFRELSVWERTSPTGVRLEVLASFAETWSLLTTSPGGETCITDSGAGRELFESATFGINPKKQEM